MAIGYNTFERRQNIKLYAFFIDITKDIPASIVDPAVTIQRWDGTQMINILNAQDMTLVADNKYVYEWQTDGDTVLDTYIVSYAATVDGLPQHESIEIVITTDTRRPEKPDGVTPYYQVPQQDPEPEEDPNKPGGVKAYASE